MRDSVFSSLSTSIDNILTPSVSVAQDWEQWLHAYYSDVITSSLANHHRDLWNYVAELKRGIRPRPYIAIWGRGQGKSSTIELVNPYLAMTGERMFGLYVSGTQDKADEHVQAIAEKMAAAGIGRKISRYGRAEGWRRNQLQTDTGFSVAAFGLNTGLRGIKIKQYRPDIIFLDDIDELTDTPKSVEKKIRIITSSVLPAGSSDCAIIGVQNLIHEESVFSSLHRGDADFILDRIMPPMVQAVEGLETVREIQEDSSYRYRITAGAAVWDGQNIATCEQQINDFGLDAFLRESQNEISRANGFYFDESAFRECELEDVPELDKITSAWDLAATENGGDYTVGVLMGISKANVAYVIDVIRVQYESNKVRALIHERTGLWQDRYKRMITCLPDDPGQAGTSQVAQFKELLKGYKLQIVRPTGSKGVRARGWQTKINAGNAFLVKAPWNHQFREEHRKFREDEEHAHDDQVDACSDAFNSMTGRARIQLIRI